MSEQAQVISALEAKLEDTKKLLANAISKKFHSLKSELAVNSMSQTNIAQGTIDQLSRKIHDCNTDIDEVYKGINKQAGRLTTVMHNLEQKQAEDSSRFQRLVEQLSSYATQEELSQVKQELQGI